MVEDKLTIRVNVAERFYPLKIDREDEANIREAVKMINEKLNQYKRVFVNHDAQDHMAMAVLQFAIKLTELQNKISSSDMADQFNEIERIIDDILDTNK